jgi:HD-GYP domain-containing protein (c-di-GMP phosphodiesterase class II)
LTAVVDMHIGPVRFQTDSAQMVFLMTAALGLKDRYTQGHAERVAVYSRRLAIRIGLPAHEVQLITLGGMLHDLGKLALSDRILSNQSAALPADMQSEVRRHPLVGAALLKRFSCSAAVCEAVLYHHERMDGSGYPFGLVADAIPLRARVVSVADCFDAITTDRPYQQHQSCENAFLMLQEMAGSCLAPDLVAAFIKDIRRNGTVRIKLPRTGS